MGNDPVVEEVRTRLDIVQLISEYLRLQKAGIRFRTSCPFHNEKDPSFYVSPERQRWHCFGCNEDGDAFEFVMKMEGMSFPEALKHLAGKAGVKLPEYNADPNRQAKNNARDRLYEANKLAAEFWHEVLLKHPAAKTVREYVQKRELNDNTVDQFMVGFAPDSWEATTNFLKKKGFTDKEIVDAGLASKSERKSGVFDRFRNRLMFPIRNAHGRYVGATGRIMPGPDGKDPDGEAKYINTAQTEIYYKGDVLFAFDLAKQAIRKSGFAIVVEGNTDAIASHQAGVENVVASSGTAFTDNQLILLKKLCDKLVLSFDADEAGEKAARRSIELAVAAGFEVRILRLPPEAGKDPDDCIRQDPEKWKRSIKQAVPFMDWYIELTKARTNFNDPYSKSRASSGLLAEVAKLSSPVEQSHWIKILSEMFETDESALMGELKQAKGSSPVMANTAPNNETAAKQPTKKLNRHGLISEYLVGIAIAWPELAENIISHILPEHLEESLNELYTALIIHYNKARTDGQDNNTDWPAAFRTGNDNTGQRLTVLELQAEKEFGELTAEQRVAVSDKLVVEIKQLHADRLKRHLAAEMAKAERADDSARVAELQQQLNEFIA